MHESLLEASCDRLFVLAQTSCVGWQSTLVMAVSLGNIPKQFGTCCVINNNLRSHYA
jgi:hypothetical protein